MEKLSFTNSLRRAMVSEFVDVSRLLFGTDAGLHDFGELNTPLSFVLTSPTSTNL